MRIYVFLGLTLSFLLSIGCANPSAREHMDEVKNKARNSPHTENMDTFWLDFRSPPEREYQHWEFYYKHCSLIGRKPYPDRAEYECMGPH